MSKLGTKSIKQLSLMISRTEENSACLDNKTVEERLKVLKYLLMLATTAEGLDANRKEIEKGVKKDDPNPH